MPGAALAHAAHSARRWIAVAAVVVPLAILMVLQLRTLSQLEDASAAAHRSALKGYRRTVLRAVEAFYRRMADDALQLPASLLRADPSTLAAHFASRDGRGVKDFFVIAFDRSTRPQFFAGEGGSSGARGDPAETRAARVAAAPWRVVAQEGTPVVSASTTVDEQDRENRIILRPVIDAEARVRGVAGAVLDSAYFRERLVPDLAEAEKGLVPEPLREHVRVRIAPRPSGQTSRAPSTKAGVPFRFVFTDAMLMVDNTSVTPEQWARWSFLANVALSLLLAGVLLAAVLFSLRSAARATQLSQMKSEFVSNVSHELRTPLASIRVFGELLRLGRVTEPDKVREYGEYIDAESRRLAQLVNNILDFSKIESGQKRYRFTRADLGAIVAETLESLQVRLRQEGFEVDLQVPPTPLPPAWVDPPAIGQVLTNLLDNAVKYSGTARRIGVTLGQQNGFVTVAVSDGGPGIAAEEQERIFEPFYRVGHGPVQDTAGSGLGLAIVKQVVEAHRGRVRVDSRPGAGTTFTVELPTHAG